MVKKKEKEKNRGDDEKGIKLRFAGRERSAEDKFWFRNHEVNVEK